ncbi:MAG: glycine cleavage system aminomethyltransferase GcvT [Alphaproteobacteria bacterium]|nr:glycine cleavage system aminomethyltransferase GcvT [Alphaproteobacteria bacterium]
MPADASPVSGDTLKTPFHAQHVALGARMVPFAGYGMPVQYRDGIIAEHNWTRENVGLFDVSHMGQYYLVADDGKHETVARAAEALMTADIAALAPGQQRYSQLLNDEGGIIDDLMIARSRESAHDGWLYMVLNAARKDVDFAHIASRLPKGVRIESADGFTALLALQGPKAVEAMEALAPQFAALRFMTTASGKLAGRTVHVTRSGYTGEDGFEIAVHGDDALHIWNSLLADARAKPIGLGARDSLRLEAGLCLYGHDIDETTSPVEAGLAWSIQKRRREEGGFPGAARIQRELKEGPARKRIGLELEGRQPAREGAEIATRDGAIIGRVTSGGFSPTLQKPIAMGYVQSGHAAVGTQVDILVRGKPLPARIVSMPFVPNRYKR